MATNKFFHPPADQWVNLFDFEDGFLVPMSIAREIGDIRKAKRQAEELATHEAYVREKEERDARNQAKKRDIPSFDDEPELYKRWSNPVAEPHSLRVIASEDPFKEIEDYTGALSNDDTSRFKALVATLLRKGAYRSSMMRCFNERDANLQRLAIRFPNFSEVIEDIRAFSSISQNLIIGPALPPMLFVGPPGVGKSYFAQELAEALHTVPPYRIEMSTAQSNSALVGSASFWSNTRPGVVFNALVNGESARPIIILEELDKVSADERFDPIGALYTLLEPNSAKNFTDLSFEFLKLDASEVIYIATANTLNMPDPIISRMNVYEIEAPNKDQTRQIVQGIWRELKKTWGNFDHNHPLDQEVIEALEELPPRRMRIALKRAMCYASLDRSFVVKAKDLGVQKKRSTIGFVK